MTEFPADWRPEESAEREGETEIRRAGEPESRRELTDRWSHRHGGGGTKIKTGGKLFSALKTPLRRFEAPSIGP